LGGIKMSVKEEETKASFCKECGNRLGKSKKIINCESNHERYRSYGDKFCRDCGKNLSN